MAGLARHHANMEGVPTIMMSAARRRSGLFELSIESFSTLRLNLVNETCELRVPEGFRV